MVVVNNVEPCDSYIRDGACCSEVCESPVMAGLPAKWSGPPQAEPLSTRSIETVLVG